MNYWKDIKNIELKKPESIKFIRRKEVQKKYNKLKDKYKKEKIDINDVIKKDVFKNGSLNEKFVFEPCKFPYFVEDGISHYILWCNPLFDWKRTLTIVFKNEIKKKLGNIEFGWFENEIKDRSVLGVKHFHIFFRKCDISKI